MTEVQPGTPCRMTIPAPTYTSEVNGKRETRTMGEATIHDVMRWGRWAVRDNPERDEPFFAVYLLEPTTDETSVDRVAVGHAWGNRTRWAAECFARAVAERFPDMASPPSKEELDVFKRFKEDFRAPSEPFNQARLTEMRTLWSEAQSRASRARDDLRDAEAALEEAEESANAWELLVEDMTEQRKRVQS